MGLVRDAARAVTVAATAGLLAGGAIGLLAPSFAEAGPSAPARAASTPVLVTDTDEAAGRLAVTLRFTNTTGAAQHIDPAAIRITTGTRTLPRLAASAPFDLAPGTRADATATFDTSTAATATTLTLTTPTGAVLTLDR